MNSWKKEGIVYEIYVQSFNDSNNDGIGDIRGIIQKLDYLKGLGVNILWLTPIFESPLVDNGYDIADYRKINPQYGTMDDVDEMIEKAHEKGLKIVMDLVVNHTSDKHEWFEKSKQSRDNEYSDYYIWRDPKEDGSAPTNHGSAFGGSAWEYCPERKQYYLHLFAKEQPDLNWENPEVREEVYDMMNFWIDKGIGGFRMDVIEMIGKQPDRMISSNGPKLHEYINEMNQKTFGDHDLLTVGETWGATPDIAKLYSDPERNELSMIFQFEATTLDQIDGKPKWFTKPLDILGLKHVLSKWQTCLEDRGWNSLFWNNHDLPRAVSQYGDDGIYRVESAKMLAIVLHLLKGTPYVYQGEELGMTNCKVEDIAEVDDIESRNMYFEEIEKGTPKEELIKRINKKGRDNARTPMQWDGTENAGFTKGTPWLHVNANYRTINAKACLEDENSIFYTYKKLIDYRKKNDIVVYGDYEMVDDVPDDVFVYLRKYKGQTLLVCANFTNEFRRINLDEFGRQTSFISNYDEGIIDLGSKVLKPYEAFAIEVK